MKTRDGNKGAAHTDETQDEVAADDDASAIDEVHERMQEAILLVRGLSSNTARALAAAMAGAGVNDEDMLREITTDEVQAVMAKMEAFEDGYPLLLPKNIAVKIRACATDTGTSPRRSPNSLRNTAISQHTATPAAVAIDGIRPIARLAVDTDTSRPGLAKTEDFLHAHVQPFAPYENHLIQIFEEVKSDWGMTAEAAERLGDRVDQLVKQSMARHIVRNMGSGIYNTFVKPQLTKEARECPVMLIWQLLAEARKVSEVDLSKRYTALLQPQRAKTVAGLTALYQHQIDEETELRMHEFVTDKKAQPLKE